jgi:hypothetical protein
MSNRRAFFSWIVVCFTVLPATATAQEQSHTWHFRGDLGGYLIHKDETGIALGAHLGRRLATWRPVGLMLDFGFTGGLGRDRFLALEVGPELRIPGERSSVHVLLGVGIGLMLESACGSPSLPYFLVIGAEARVSSRSRIRGTLRPTWHSCTGDPGVFDGPHLLSVGWVQEF